MRSFHLITVHPRFVDAYAAFGAFRAAAQKGVANVSSVDLRDFAVDRHGSVDDSPYGGGDGMVMRPEPLAAAVASVTAAVGERPLVVLTTPAGRVWSQRDAERFAASPRPVAFVCGRFAGVDQRFVDALVDEQYSCGDVVLTGGELPALMMVDSVVRLLPGVLGHEESAARDSFAPAFAGGLEHPLYTRPVEWDGRPVPPVLLSGDHAKIDAWKREESARRTRELRPDLVKGRCGDRR